MATLISLKHTFLFNNFKRFSYIKRNASSKKIYELRTYNLKPECVKPFVNMTLEKFHIRTQASKLNGYWSTELGGINQVVHIWEYGNSQNTNMEYICNGIKIEFAYFRKLHPSS